MLIRNFIFLFFRRYLAPRPISNCTPRYTCAKRNPTNAPNVLKLSQTPRISPNIHASIWALNHIAVKSASANLPNYHICSNIYARILATNPTNVDIPAVKRLSLNFPTCNRIRAAIKRTSHSNVIPATNASPMNHRCWNIYPSTKSPNI